MVCSFLDSTVSKNVLPQFSGLLEYTDSRVSLKCLPVCRTWLHMAEVCTLNICCYENSVPYMCMICPACSSKVVQHQHDSSVINMLHFNKLWQAPFLKWYHLLSQEIWPLWDLNIHSCINKSWSAVLTSDLKECPDLKVTGLVDCSQLSEC
jgi:hypothetical protein